MWFCEWYKTEIKFHSFACEFLVFSQHFIEIEYPFPFEFSWLFCQILVDGKCVGFFFWALCSVLWFHVSIFMPVSCCFTYYCFVFLQLGPQQVSHLTMSLSCQNSSSWSSTVPSFHDLYLVHKTLIEAVLFIVFHHFPMLCWCHTALIIVSL